MKEQWKAFSNLILKGHPFVVVSIVEKSGSAPRGTGARMIVNSDLSISGTVGGGRLEADAITQAGKIFKDKISRVTRFELTGKDAAEMEMICGGNGKLLMVYVDPKSEDYITLSEALLDCEREKKNAWLLTAIDEMGRARQKLVHENLEEMIHSYEALGGQQIFVEEMANNFDLYLFGAGHVAQCVAPIGESVGFNTIVVDDRIEFANRKRFPNSKIILVPNLEDPLPELPIDKRSYVAIMTRGHLQDKEILSQILKYAPAYVGMIGSKRKRELIYRNLIETEGYSPSDFERVHCPIGVDISAESPEEIAISIVAELVKVRASNICLYI